MSKKANKTMIGVFVVAGIAMLAAAVIIFGSGKFFQNKEQYVAFFEGSVKGLRIGAPVMFRGVRIGEVTDVSLVYHMQDTSFEIPVMITLYPDKIIGMGFEMAEKIEDENNQEWEQLLAQGLRAELQMQSLVTGQLLVELDFHPDSPLKLYGFKDLKLRRDVKEIPTIKSGLALLGKKIEQLPLDDIAADLRSSLQGINSFVNSPEFGKSLHYFKQALRDARNFIRHLDGKVDPLFAQVDQTLLDAQKLLQNVNDRIEPLASSLVRTADDADKLIQNVNKRIGPIQADLNKTTAALRAALNSAESALGEIDEIVEDDSEVRYYIDVFLREMTMAARSVRALANYLERNPDALLRGKVSKTSQEEGR
jgi:paraquat-inducible protein B